MAAPPKITVSVGQTRAMMLYAPTRGVTYSIAARICIPARWWLDEAAPPMRQALDQRIEVLFDLMTVLVEIRRKSREGLARKSY